MPHTPIKTAIDRIRERKYWSSFLTPDQQLFNATLDMSISILTALLPEEEKFAEEAFIEGRVSGTNNANGLNSVIDFPDYYSQFKPQTNGQ